MKTGDSKAGSRAIEAYMPSSAKEWERGLRLEGEVGNSQEGEKGRC